MSCLITMSQRELHRLEVIQKIRQGSMSVVEAAEKPLLERWNSASISQHAPAAVAATASHFAETEFSNEIKGTTRRDTHMAGNHAGRDNRPRQDKIDDAR